MIPKSVLLCLLTWTLALATSSTSALAGPRRHQNAPAAGSAPANLPYELENTDLPTVFRMLAHEARAGIDLDPSIRGTTNIRLEDIDAKQAIQILADSEDMSVEFKDNTYHIRATPKTDDAHRGETDLKKTDSMEGIISTAIAQALDGMLDYLAKPETAAKLARHKRGYYLALVQEGFSAEEALKIVVAENNSDFLGGQKTK